MLSPRSSSIRGIRQETQFTRSEVSLESVDETGAELIDMRTLGTM